MNVRFQHHIEMLTCGSLDSRCWMGQRAIQLQALMGLYFGARVYKKTPARIEIV